MNHLAISPASPYDSQNASRVSLVSNLQQQRGITTAEQRPNGASPLSPLGPRAGSRATQAPRRAPVINPNPRSVSGMPDPMASAPTKGYAWAFPDEIHERRGSSSGESSAEHSMSRQNSYAPSINSSIFTTDSTLPSGQRRFGEDGTHSYLSIVYGADFTRHDYYSPPLHATPHRDRPSGCGSSGDARWRELQPYPRTPPRPQIGGEKTTKRDEESL
jgi:hypothetical protein